MAARVVKPACCGRARKSAPTDFCGALRISTGVTLTQMGNSWTVQIQSGGKLVELNAALAAHKCDGNSAGAKLVQVTSVALARVIAMGKADQLRQKAGRQMPLILLKDFLFKTAGACASCRGLGRGCAACGGMGV